MINIISNITGKNMERFCEVTAEIKPSFIDLSFKKNSGEETAKTVEKSLKRDVKI